MIAVGIDPGATTGFAIFNGVELSFGASGRGAVLGFPLLRLTAARKPTIVAIETIEAVYPRARFGSKMATALVHSARLAGEFTAVARDAGCLVIEVSAGRWRKGLTGKANASDKLIKAALAPLLVGKRTNAHVRDALGLARHAWLWATKTPDGIEAVRCHEWKEVLGP